MIISVPLTPNEILLVIVVFSVASAVQSTTGFGSVILSGPVLVLIEPRFIPGPVLMAGVVLSLLIVLREGLQVNVGDVVRLNLGRLAGSAAGALLLVHMSADLTAIVLAVTLLSVVTASALGLSVAVSHRTLMITGVVSGVAGTVAALAGATTVVLLQNERGMKLRGSMAGYMLPGTLISLGAVALAGRVTAVELGLFLVLLPAIFGGNMLWRRFSRILDRYVSKPLVLSLSAIASLTIIGRFVLRAWGLVPG